MRILKYIGIGVFILIINHSTFSQALTCDEAIILNSIDELDGITGSMFAENPNDEPTPLCPGTPGAAGNPQNMNWFAFIANSSSATLEITFSNCIEGISIQYGIYTNCNFEEYLTGVCEGDAVSVNDPVVVDITGMTVGEEYFLFIDGDLGTYCDFVFDVLCSDGLATIPQPTGVNCISDNCPIDGNVCSKGETYTFEPAGLDLEIDYFWTVTPSPPMGTMISGDNDFSATFTEIGVYEICVVSSNDCTETTPVCYTLNVVEADGGTMSADPDSLFIGETSIATAVGFFESSPVLQAMVAIGPDDDVIAAEWGGVIDVTYSEVGTVTVYGLNFIPVDIPTLPSVGDPFTLPDCIPSCCDTNVVDIVFIDESTSLSNSIIDNALEVHVYPNPTKRKLKIDIKNPNSNKMKLSILDNNGRRVETIEYAITSTQSIDLDLTKLSSGSYQLILDFGDEVINKKIIKIE